jgi:predicted TIM-barrel fold metal-dependent hydrolase
VLPPDYRALPQEARVAGTVVVEASPWIEDNQWVLDLAARDPFIVGLVGNLPAGTPSFSALLERFAANPLFRGIRVPERRLASGLGDSAFVADLGRLAERGLALDVLGSPGMLPDVARLARTIPRLEIVIDHVAGVRIDGGTPPADWRRGLRQVAPRTTVSCKISGLVEGTGRTGGAAPGDAGFYRPVLDHVWECFGPDRLIYGSNWPVSEMYADLGTVQRLAVGYLSDKGERASRSVLAGNARRVYRWVDRTAG